MTTPVVPTYPAAGSAVPVHAVSGPSIGGPAIPVYVVSDGRPTLGQPPRRVKLITDADLAINGGNYWIEGRPFAMPVAVSTATSGDEGNVAIPVYAVNAWPGASTPAWLPTNIAGLSLWVKADAGLYKDAAKTQPATVGDDVVYVAADQSGNGNDLVQATLASRPLLKLAIQNNKPCLLFDGSNDFMKALFAGNQPTHVFIAFKFAVAPGGGSCVIDGGAEYQAWLENGGSLQMYSGAYGAAVTIASLGTSFHLAELVFSGANSFLKIDNGADSATVDAGAVNPTGFTIGAFQNGVSPVNIYVGEIAVYHAILSAQNRLDARTYFNTTRWVIF